jgi:hypothetical protein
VPLKAPTINYTSSILLGENAELNTLQDIPAISRLFMATYAAAVVPPMPVVMKGYANASYELPFVGPLITCRHSLNSSEAAVMSAVINATGMNTTASHTPTALVYALFAPSDFFFDSQGNPNSTFDYALFVSACVFRTTQDLQEPLLLGYCGEPNVFSGGVMWAFTGGQGWACQGQNATFQGRFDISTQSQTVTVDPTRTKLTSKIDNASPETPALMYGMVFTSIWQLLAGLLYIFQDSLGNPFINENVTSVANTALLGSLRFDEAAAELGLTSFDTTEYFNPSDLALARNLTLPELIEELSQNITLSFFSRTDLWSVP